MIMLTAYTIQPMGAMRQNPDFLPEVAGVYALLLDDPVALAPALERAHLSLDPLRLGQRAILYLGSTGDSLRRRLKCHLSHDTCRSTFRMSLGALLADELGLEVRVVSGQRYFGFEPASEQRLSRWIDDNMSVALRTSNHALVEEKSLIASSDPVLNIQGRSDRISAGTVVLMRHRLRGLPFEAGRLQ